MVAAPRCPSLVLMLLLFCCVAASAAADHKLTHLHFYFREIEAGPNATIVDAISLNKNGGPAFGDVRVFDNELREGPDPASRLIGRAQGYGVNASLDSSSIFTAIDFVFSDYGEYSGGTLATQGNFDPTGGPSERTIVGGTGKLRFARGYMTSQVQIFPNNNIAVVFDMYFTLAL